MPDEHVLAGLNDYTAEAAQAADPDGSCPACGAVRAAAVGPRPRLKPGPAPATRARLLTDRERAVFRLLGYGYDNRSIARELEISERTVKRYVTAILAKLELESRLQAGLAALVTRSPRSGDASWPG